MLRQLVQSAIGFDADARRRRHHPVAAVHRRPRGRARWSRPAPASSPQNGARLIQLGVLAAVVLALIVFVLRPLAARRPVLEITELTGPREAPAGQPRLDRPARRHPRPAGADRHQHRAPARRHLQPHRGLGRGAQELDRVPRNPQGGRRVMNAYRLERFSPAFPSGPTPSMIERRIDTVREESYRLGFLAGQAAANEAFLDEQGRLTSDLVEAIADARLTNEAARRHVAASIGPDDRGARLRHRPGARRGRPRGRGRPDRRARPGAGARRAAAAALRPGGRGRGCRPARRARPRRHRRGGARSSCRARR